MHHPRPCSFAMWVWTDQHSLAFFGLKTQPFHPEAQSSLVTDASKFAIGAALVQVIKRVQKQVVFYSCKLVAASMNYTNLEPGKSSLLSETLCRCGDIT